MLHLIATPIGNLGDITYRSIEVLQKCEYLLCEDTRHTLILLQRYGIAKPLKSYHQFNEARREEEIIADLKRGAEIGLLSDAGTPIICDPGLRLIRRCRKERLPYTSLPGPCAAILAYTLSGEEADRFQFVGFLPRKSSQMRKIFQEILSYPGATICYETPHRILKTLDILIELAPERRLTIARELTKIYEECLQGTAIELKKHFTHKAPKGEMVLIFSEEK